MGGGREHLVSLIRSTRRSGDADLRVLFVTNMWPEPERAWYGTFIQTQAESLERVGIDVDVLYVRGYLTGNAYPKAIARMASLSRSKRWDLVHAHYGHSGVVARADVRHPLVVSYCGDDLLGTPTPTNRATLRSRAEVALFRRLAHVASATITKSEAMEAVLPRSCVERNHVIPNGVDVDRFRPIPRDEARRRLGWPDDEQVVLFAGNPEIPRKNYPLAAAACESLSNGGASPSLRVAWGIPPDAMPIWMSAADALLLTSLSEGSPNVVKEALACELPVVATPVGDVPERLRAVSGCHVARPEIGELGSALSHALEHGRAEEARQAVSALTLDRVAARVRAVYEEVLARRTRALRWRRA